MGVAGQVRNCNDRAERLIKGEEGTCLKSGVAKVEGGIGL